MNRIIELHDSELDEVARYASDLVVTLGTAYVHESDGDAGIDPGKVYLQRAILRIANGRLNKPFTFSQAKIADGTLVCGGAVSPNYLPVPLAFRGATSLSPTVWGNLFSATLEVQGDGINLELIGEPVYLRDFPADSRVGPPN